MASTKTKQRIEEEKINQGIIEGTTSKADDKTAIDDIEKKKEKLPKGTTRLEAGTIREIRVVSNRLGLNKGKVFRITDTETGKHEDYDNVKIEGQSELVHVEERRVCGVVEKQGSAHVETESSILVTRKKR